MISVVRGVIVCKTHIGCIEGESELIWLQYPDPDYASIAWIFRISSWSSSTVGVDWMPRTSFTGREVNKELTNCRWMANKACQYFDLSGNSCMGLPSWERYSDMPVASYLQHFFVYSLGAASQKIVGLLLLRAFVEWRLVIVTASFYDTDFHIEIWTLLFRWFIMQDCRGSTRLYSYLSCSKEVGKVY